MKKLFTIVLIIKPTIDIEIFVKIVSEDLDSAK